ncbi:unnamed protein product [Ectocarpus sp. 8 AP-2014]
MDVSNDIFRGHLDVLRWARNNGCPWDGHAVERLRSGISKVQWARDNGCPWDEATCSSAASEGVCWARGNGCPWDEATCSNVTSGGQYFNGPETVVAPGTAGRTSKRLWENISNSCNGPEATDVRGTRKPAVTRIGGHLEVLR